jgi:hypothetical protein
MKTVTVKVEFQMPVGHLDADSILDQMQGAVYVLLENYGITSLTSKTVDKLCEQVSVEIVDASSVPDDLTG